MAGPQARAGRFSIRYGDEVIAFALRLQPQRRAARVAIHVEADGRVLVDAPEGAAHAAVIGAVKKRAAWIAQQVAGARARRAAVQCREYVSGESLLYLGRRYRLKVVIDPSTPPGAALRGAFLIVTVALRSPALVRDGLNAWYRQRAKAVFADRLRAVAAPLRWVRSAPPLQLRSMRFRWGSCSPAGRITLNPELVKAPRECIDCVLLHELVHRLHHNHSPAFYRVLDRHLPRWSTVKLKLDGMAEAIFRA